MTKATSAAIPQMNLPIPDLTDVRMIHNHTHLSTATALHQSVSSLMKQFELPTQEINRHSQLLAALGVVRSMEVLESWWERDPLPENEMHSIASAPEVIDVVQSIDQVVLESEEREKVLVALMDYLDVWLIRIQDSSGFSGLAQRQKDNTNSILKWVFSLIILQVLGRVYDWAKHEISDLLDQPSVEQLHERVPTEDAELLQQVQDTLNFVSDQIETLSDPENDACETGCAEN